MKWDSWNDSMLLVSGASSLALGAAAIGAPKQYQDLYLPKAGAGADAVKTQTHGMTRAFGAAALGAAAFPGALLLEQDTGKKGKKAALKGLGVAWAAAAGVQGYQMIDNKVKRDAVTYSILGARILLSAASLGMGFYDEDKPKKEKKEKKL